MTKIKIALAEDNQRLAEAIRDKLAIFDDVVTFKFHALNGVALLKQLENDPDIDVILMDIEMPDMDGIEATAEVKKNYPEIRIVMLTVFDDEDKIFRAIQAGANGYLLKDEPAGVIVDGIKSIRDGGAPMSPSIAAKTLNLLRNPSSVQEPEARQEITLTRREVEVLEHISQGLDYQKIANTLFVSPSTVRKHIENIYRKLHVHNKIEAVLLAQKHKLI
ncbi:MAG TPA: response regulator transcription factor [Caldithrix abyssi]|uniref:Response regulator transcription factor n=1 Tax=Caldithrix abyssi TaxID=187145 RepID=A0A7V4U009_CALAY|nr:response regulator transcription factor [Caldithrix abyssi]